MNGTGFKRNFMIISGEKGNDNNPGSQDKPFKTIVKARDTIRNVKNTTGLPDGGITVIRLSRVTMNSQMGH